MPGLLTARLAIVDGAVFGPRPGEPFQQVFGEAGPQASAPPVVPDAVGGAWLAALRTREALLRGDRTTAAAALDALRDALIVLAGFRTGAPAGYLEPRDRDRIRTTETSARDLALVREAFAAAVQILDEEFTMIAPHLADAVVLPMLEELAG